MTQTKRVTTEYGAMKPRKRAHVEILVYKTTWGKGSPGKKMERKKKSKNLRVRRNIRKKKRRQPNE